MEKEPTRQEIIESCIAWKLRDPSRISLFIGEREVVAERELGERRRKPDLPRVYGTLFEYKDRKLGRLEKMEEMMDEQRERTQGISGTESL